MAQVRNIVLDMTVLPFWPWESRHGVIALLREVAMGDIHEVYRSVAGPTAPQLPTNSTYLDAFSLLETLNARPDGLPKPLVFIEHLAVKASPDIALELQRWTSLQAELHGLTEELVAARKDIRNAKAPISRKQKQDGYLVFSLQRVGTSGDKYELVHWRQLGMQDGWFPRRAAEFVGNLAAVKHQVARLIEYIEGHWSDHDPDYRVEFVLSGELLNLDVDQWAWETDSPIPQPLGCHYSVVVRSLERMTKQKWHREWRARWDELTAQLGESGAISEESNCWGDDVSPAGLRKLTAGFDRKPTAVSLVLSSPPRAESSGRDQVAVALRAGVPMILWHRENCNAVFFRTARDLLHGGGETGLLERVRVTRTDAFADGPESGHCGQALTVLYDDPHRTVVPIDPKAPEGTAA
jgi:NTP-dependent ternary conflict system VMAP-like protein